MALWALAAAWMLEGSDGAGVVALAAGFLVAVTALAALALGAALRIGRGRSTTGAAPILPACTGLEKGGLTAQS